MTREFFGIQLGIQTIIFHIQKEVCMQHKLRFIHLFYISYICNEFIFYFVDEYYLVDSGYPNTKGYLAPYKGERYHLAQFDHRHPQIAHEKFKKTHSSLRSVIERSFGVWKAIWPFMKDIPCNYNFVCQRQLVCATMAIHNFIRHTNLRDIAFDSYNKHIEYVLVDDEAVVGEDRHGHPIRNDDYEMDSRRYEILMSISQGNNY
ncbi:hypothetical protein CsSME_00025007 [Camellia sinensis var. sinensis]